MLIQIARFEIRLLLRNPLLWGTALFLFALFLVSMSTKEFQMGSEGGLLYNASVAVLRNYLSVSLMFMFVTTAFVANAVLRDDDTGFGPIIRATPITKFEYVFGRYIGAFATTMLLLLIVPAATIIGTLMPWADPATLGPNRIADHLYGIFLIALPNILLHSALFFALATITRSMMATYLGVVVLIGAFFTLQDALRRPGLETSIAIAEPFGFRALHDAVRYWTVAERNVLLPEFAGALLYNRLLWIGLALLCLAGTFFAFRFSDQGVSRRERKKRKLAAHAESSSPVFDGSRSIPSPKHDSAALRAVFWMRTKFEFRQVLKSPAFAILMVWALNVTLSALLNRGSEYRPQYPTTLSLIPELEDAMVVIPLIIAIYYAGELVWRERDRRVHELIDASPMPNWAYVVPKALALGAVLMSLALATVVAAVIVQLADGFARIEPGKYLLWYVLPETFDVVILAALAMFIQSLSPHKAVGWGVMTLFLAWRESRQSFIEHNLLIYGGGPKMPLSDLNGAATFWAGAWTFRLYWGAFAVLLLVAAHLLWRRGTELRLMPRITNARRRIAGAPGVVAAVALLVFASTGAYAFYSVNVVNEYRTPEERELEAVEYERRFAKYADVRQPSVEEMTLEVDVYPDQRRVVTRGRFVLRNRSSEAIRDLHLRLLGDDTLALTKLTIFDAQRVFHDTKYRYWIYKLDAPMAPGEERTLTFETLRHHRGFRNEVPDTGIVANGTFLTESELMPVLGMNRNSFIGDPEKREKYGLPPIAPPKLEDLDAASRPSFSHQWVKKVDITLSTDAGQTPVAPGKKTHDVTRDGRRTARFVSTAPIRPEFSIQSARYAERHRNHRGVDLAVYYHPGHEWNVERMLDAASASLDEYTANFGPYQFDHFRIVEFPAYRNYAQAFAGTIPFSESVGFTLDYGKRQTLDEVFGMVAHEFAHQWFPHQMMPAEVEGHDVLVETLAQYAAHMLIKEWRGEEQIRGYLEWELDWYLWLRGRSDREEQPLARVVAQDHVAYRKGAVVMYLVQQRLGEAAVNRALRSLLDRYRFRHAPLPRSVDLIAALKAEATSDEDRALITDLFEKITLYDLRAVDASAVQRADGRWDVTLQIEAGKSYADGAAAETSAPINERIEIGLFTESPGDDDFDQPDVMLFERHRLQSGRQTLKLVTAQKPAFAGVDPYHFYIDRKIGDNVVQVR